MYIFIYIYIYIHIYMYISGAHPRPDRAWHDRSRDWMSRFEFHSKTWHRHTHTHNATRTLSRRECLLRANHMVFVCSSARQQLAWECGCSVYIYIECVLFWLIRMFDMRCGVVASCTTAACAREAAKCRTKMRCPTSCAVRLHQRR